MYVCLSVTGLRLKYTGLRIVYVPLWHVPLTMPLQKTTPKQVQRYERPQQKVKDDKVMVARKDLHISTRAIYFAR